MSNAPTITLTCDKCTRPVDVHLPGHFDWAARADIANAAKLRGFRCPECCGEDAIHCEGDAARTLCGGAPDGDSKILSPADWQAQESDRCSLCEVIDRARLRSIALS